MKSSELWSLNRSRALERMNQHMLKRAYYRLSPPEYFRSECKERNDFWSRYSSEVGEVGMKSEIALAPDLNEWDHNEHFTE